LQEAFDTSLVDFSVPHGAVALRAGAEAGENRFCVGEEVEIVLLSIAEHFC